MSEVDQKLDFSGVSDKSLVSLIDELYRAGAHFGYSKTRRNSSVKSYIYSSKNRMDIIDLEKMAKSLRTALDFVAKLGSEGKQILFVGNKKEARKIVEDAAKSINMPYVSLRWIGGTLTNAPEIRKRVARMEDLVAKKGTGGLDMYTKKERLLIDREIARLEKNFLGIASMKRSPAALIVVDARNEFTAITEAGQMRIPVVALTGTDTDIKNINYPIVGNDASQTSLALFMDKIVAAYKEGVKIAPKIAPQTSVVPNARVAKAVAEM